MTELPPTPKKYRQTVNSRERFIEGWKDAQAGRPHAYPPGDVAEEFKRHNGWVQLNSYTAGYEAGRKLAP